MLAPSALITAILGIFLIHPQSYNSIKDFPQLEVLPNAPPGYTIQSGASQFRYSNERYGIVFCPSILNGFIELTV